MFFSSDLKACARKGEFVTIRGSSSYHLPYEVARRFKRKDKLDQVYFELVNELGAVMEPKKVEVFSFWPAEGDTVLFSIREYLDWLVEQKGVQANLGNYGAMAQIQKRLRAYGADSQGFGGDVTQLLHKYKLIQVEGDLGVVSYHGENIKAPLKALAVIQKEDGRICH